jgi:hypothetical protein
MYVYVCPTGLHNRLCGVPLASIKTPIPHGFVLREGLADPMLMQQWMAGVGGKVHHTDQLPQAAATAATSQVC